MGILFKTLCCLLVFSSGLYAHKTNEAFFRIVPKESVIEVETEFPWTLRNALLKFRPALENASDRSEFQIAFIDYLKANLKLIDSNGEFLDFVKFEEIKNLGNSHQNSYIITYKGTAFEKIENTLLFNIFDNQVNYHRITLNGVKTIFKTTNTKAYYDFQQGIKFDSWWIIAVIVTLILISPKLANQKIIYYKT